MNYLNLIFISVVYLFSIYTYCICISLDTTHLHCISKVVSPLYFLALYLYSCISYVSLWIYFSGCISSALHYISIVVSPLYLYGCISPVSSLYFHGSDSFVSLLSYLLCISSLSQLLYLLCIFSISPLISITVSPLNLLYISMVVSPLYLYGCIFSKSLWREDRYFTSIESTLYGFKVISISHSSMHRVYCTGQTIMYNLDLQNRRTPPLLPPF